MTSRPVFIKYSYYECADPKLYELLKDDKELIKIIDKQIASYKKSGLILRSESNLFYSTEYHKIFLLYQSKINKKQLRMLINELNKLTQEIDNHSNYYEHWA